METIFDTTKNSFMFSDLYMEIGTDLTSNYFYGMGERRRNAFRYTKGKYSTWNIGINKFNLFYEEMIKKLIK